MTYTPVHSWRAFSLLWSNTDKAHYCPFDTVYLLILRKSLHNRKSCKNKLQCESHCRSLYFLSIIRYQRNQMTYIWKRHYPPSHKCNYRTALKGFINWEKKMPSHLTPFHIILSSLQLTIILWKSIKKYNTIKTKHIRNT